ncbi:phosphoribosylanthranilate isomerase [Neobacillus ginsengisoli]|uniref:N-(5'-phosphoribosyl)anthranilate isomerase n=1 Tax=Neobacillus ginsengisoli TaxID=904295 RepID=A0ABT9XQ96_9BACI|nr:phosphoribosylanthranilate isomerase [Neobacillus ginsengisoli]MDQ0197718.1 phosphoribosylanthranilate isomerase [Neobacillus ginsengisoli]
MKVKICGITDAATAIEAVKYGADAIGLVFAESKRRVSINQGREIVRSLPKNVLKVGVFVNESKEEIEKIASNVGLTHIQLHGDEPATFSRSLSLPVIKALSLQNNERMEDVINYPCEYMLLDGPKGKYRGGNGTTFDWTSINSANFKGKKVILAGGLTVENVEEGIRLIGPFMVDVSSGVETEGRKDLKKIQSFIEKAKGKLIGGKTK